MAAALSGDPLHLENVYLPFPPGAWNSVRALFAYGKAAWSLHGPAAREWMTLPLAAARRSQSHLANRLLLQAAAMVRYDTAVAASLPFPAEALRGATAFLR